MACVLSDENLALLTTIGEQKPDEINTLARVVGRHAPKVSRSLHTMEQYGLVKLIKSGRTVVPRTTFEHRSVEFC